VAGEKTHEQPRPGAGIAHVEHIAGFRQPADPTAANPPDAVFRRLALIDPRTQGAHCRRGAQDVLALQQPADGGLPTPAPRA